MLPAGGAGALADGGGTISVGDEVENLD